MGNIVVKLRKVIDSADGPIDELTLREPEFGDMIRMKSGLNEAQMTAEIISACSGVAQVFLAKLSLADVARIQRKLAPFLSPEEDEED
jgi:hypothetical protein